MLGVIGLPVSFGIVFSGYVFAGGHLSVVIHALPSELMIIFGGATGALVIGSTPEILKGVIGGIKQVFSSPKWKEQDFTGMLCLRRLAHTPPSLIVISNLSTNNMLRSNYFV